MKIDWKTAAITIAAIAVLSRIEATEGIIRGVTGGNRFWR